MSNHFHTHYRFSMNKQFMSISMGPMVEEDKDLPWYTGKENITNIDKFVVYVLDIPNHDLPAHHVTDNDRIDLQIFRDFTLDSCTYLNTNDRRFVYKRSITEHEEYNYLKVVLSIIMDKSNEIREDRTKVGTYSIFGPQMEFDISRSIPILTTKFLAWKVVLKELLWFLKGDTNSKHLEEQGVSIWKGNTTREFLDQRGLDYPEGDVGPMYGFQWRHWGASYETCNHGYEGKGYDQLNELVKQIKIDPYSRRHLLTTYNPSEVSKSVLAPCHGLTTMFYVDKGGYLSCKVFCRSSDVFLGLPFNIASYAMMTYILAMKCDLKPKRLIVTMGDAHIYSNHYEQANEQLYRTPIPFPKFKVSETVKEKQWEDLTMDDFELEGYLYHPSIKAPMAV